MKEVIALFYAFAKVGILGFGGGHSIIPLIQIEVVNNYKWLTIEEFTEALAMANSLPGPITTKMSIFTGYKIAVWFRRDVQNPHILRQCGRFTAVENLQRKGIRQSCACLRYYLN